MSTGEIEGVEPYLRNAERWLDAMSADGRGPQDRPPDMVVVDEEAFRRLPTWVAVHRAGQALVLGDRAGCITHARRALDLAGPDDHVGRAAASALIGLASWGDGDVAAAQAGYAESWTDMQRAGHIADILGLAITLGDLHVVQGRLGDAMRTYEQALRLAAEQDGPVLRGTADMYVGMAALHRERDDLPAATELLLRSQELGEHLGLPQNPHRWRVAMARVREAEGDLDGAATLLDDAERVYAGDFSPDVRPIPAMRARVWIAQGRLGRRPPVGPRAGPVGRRRPELPARVRARHPGQAAAGAVPHRAQHQLRAAGARAAAASPPGSRGRRPDRQRHRDPGAAGARRTRRAATPWPLSRRWSAPSTLAEPEGYVRIFVDEGPPMARPARSGRAARDRPGLRPAAADHLRRDAGAADRRRPGWSSR